MELTHRIFLLSLFSLPMSSAWVQPRICSSPPDQRLLLGEAKTLSKAFDFPTRWTGRTGLLICIPNLRGDTDHFMVTTYWLDNGLHTGHSTTLLPSPTLLPGLSCQHQSTVDEHTLQEPSRSVSSPSLHIQSIWGGRLIFRNQWNEFGYDKQLSAIELWALLGNILGYK